jgi:hypothetical protein
LLMARLFIPCKVGRVSEASLLGERRNPTIIIPSWRQIPKPDAFYRRSGALAPDSFNPDHFVYPDGPQIQFPLAIFS